jgi:hypothetical protein
MEWIDDDLTRGDGVSHQQKATEGESARDDGDKDLKPQPQSHAGAPQLAFAGLAPEVNQAQGVFFFEVTPLNPEQVCLLFKKHGCPFGDFRVVRGQS